MFIFHKDTTLEDLGNGVTPLYGQNAYHLTFLKHRFDFDHISILICMTQKQIAIK